MGTATRESARETGQGRGGTETWARENGVGDSLHQHRFLLICQSHTPAACVAAVTWEGFQPVGTSAGRSPRPSPRRVENPVPLSFRFPPLSTPTDHCADF